ncbi:hypothetical protein G6F40_014412 [Rhizopus arrhizus]|nr:hypothetical protein G6F40_014412 [Rhizopus arrhizus]
MFPQQAVTVGLQIRVLVALVVHDAAAQFQALIEQARAQRPVARQLGNGLGQQVATDEAVLHAVRHQAAVRVQQHRRALVTHFVFQRAGDTQIGEEAPVVEARLQLDAADGLLVDVVEQEVAVALDHVPGLVHVVGQLDVGIGGVAEQGRQVVHVANLVVARAAGDR